MLDNGICHIAPHYFLAEEVVHDACLYIIRSILYYVWLDIPFNQLGYFILVFEDEYEVKYFIVVEYGCFLYSLSFYDIVELLAQCLCSCQGFVF